MNRIHLVLFFVSISSLPKFLPAQSGSNTARKLLTMQEAVKLAVTRAPEVRIADAQSARAREAVREVRSINRPQLYTGTGLAYNNGYPLSMEGAAPSIFQVGASQPLLSKTNRNLVKEAEQAGKASQFGAESVRNELASRAAFVYYELFKSGKAIDIALKRLDLARKQLLLTETLLDAGRVLPVDVTTARTAVSAIQHQLLIAEEQANLAETELRQLTGIPQTIGLQTIEPQIDDPILNLHADSAYRQILESSPEVRQAQANLRAKEFHVEAVKGESLPQADIVSQYALFSKTNNYNDYFNRFTRNNFLFGLSLKVPIFDGSRTSSRVLQSRQETEEARANLERVKSNLKLRIERGMSALRIARGALELARNDAAAAREMAQVSETLLDSGRITPKDLEDSRSVLYQKELAVLDADQAVYQRKLELLSATGSLSSLFSE